MARPLTPLVITSFAGENDTNPATELDDKQGSYIQNLYIVQGGLERRLGGSLINTPVGSNFIQGMSWCSLDPALSGSSGGAMMNPLDSSISGSMVLYLRSDQVVGTHGALVTDWNDLSSNAWHVTQANAALQPTVYDPGGGASRMIRFVGGAAGDSMGRTIGVGNFPVETNGYTFYWYGTLRDQTGALPGGYVFNTNLGTGPMLIAESWDEGQGLNNNSVGWRDDVGFNVGATGVSTFVTGVKTWVFTPPSGTGLGKVYQDGVEGHSAVWTFAGGSGHSSFGINSDSGEADMDLGLFLWYSEAHDTATREAIERWIVNYFEG
jgi:hypothetical protein